MHGTIDAFVPRAPIRVYQIVGIGRTTISGLKYSFDKIGSFKQEFDYEHVLGDGTVLPRSAAAIGNADTFVVNLKDCNDNDLDPANRDHAHMMELPSAQELVRRILVEDIPPRGNPAILCLDIPAVGIRNFLIRARSPVVIGAVDSRNRRTGAITIPSPGGSILAFEEQIPNSTYVPPDDLWLSPEQGPYIVELRGTELGTVGLEISEFVDNDRVGTVEYPPFPVTEGTIISFRLMTLADADSVSFDANGDGTADATFSSLAAADPGTYAQLLIQVVRIAQLPVGIQQSLLAKLDGVLKSLQGGNRASAKGKLNAYLSEVRALAGKQIPASTADSLTAFGRILQALSVKCDNFRTPDMTK